MSVTGRGPFEGAIRQWLASGGSEQMLGQISGELHFLNASIANMVRDMSVMSYSVGSTMGRAGSWMPWQALSSA